MFGKSNRGKSFIAGCGFMLAAIAPLCSAQATGYKVLYNFTRGTDGKFPAAALTRDSVSGRLYGTTGYGGGRCGRNRHGCGTIYAVDPGGTETVLYSFAGGADGAYPFSHALLDKAGNLFTTTSAGGQYNHGTIFELKADGTTNAVPFANGAPSGDLIADSSGNLYGTTFVGGANNLGTVFEYQPGGTIKTLHAFSGPDGAYPVAGLIQDAAGNLYGTTTAGGGNSCGDGCGTIFKLATDGTETVLYSFTGGSDGDFPVGGVLMDAAGDLFSTTLAGGDLNCIYNIGCGTIFELKADGSTNAVPFEGTSNGEQPYAGLIADSAGNLYGTTSRGGKHDRGTVFVYPPGGAITVLHSFAGQPDGAYPDAGLIADGAGHLYGTTYRGGIYGNGTVFKIAE